MNEHEYQEYLQRLVELNEQAVRALRNGFIGLVFGLIGFGAGLFALFLKSCP